MSLIQAVVKHLASILKENATPRPLGVENPDELSRPVNIRLIF